MLVENQWLLAEVEQYRNSEAVRVALHLSPFLQCENALDIEAAEGCRGKGVERL